MKRRGRDSGKGKGPGRDSRLKLPDLPCDPEVPKAPPPPSPAGSGCSTGTGLKQYREILRGKK